MEKTKAEIRFSRFVQSVKSAKTDYDIAVAGWDLLEWYRGFKSRQLAGQTLYILEHIFKKGE